MPFPTPHEIEDRKQAQFYEESLRSARSYTESVLSSSNGPRCNCSAHCNDIRIRYLSTDRSAVEQVANELETSGWTVVKRELGGFTHYLTVRPKQ